MTSYADLHLKVPPDGSLETIESLLKEDARLGYRLIGVAFSPEVPAEYISKLRLFSKSINVDLVTRVDLAPLTTKELLVYLKSVRRRFEVVAVKCNNKQIARQAAKDRRVDVLSFSTDPRKRFFDKAEAELASKSFATLEIDMASILELKGLERARLISCLRREVLTAQRFDVPILLSSGTHDKFLLRKPREYIALTQLFDMDFKEAKIAISDTPYEIVARNRRKLSPNYVCPGVYIVRRGKNCLSI